MTRKRGCAVVSQAPAGPGGLLRAELMSILAEGEIDVSRLHRVQAVASAGIQLLRAIGSKDVGEVLRTSGLGGVGPLPGFASVELPMPESVGGETYGASVLRELVPLARSLIAQSKKLSPERLVSAIAEAREQGLDDIETRLREELEALLSERPAHEDGVGARPGLADTEGALGGEDDAGPY